MKAKYLLVALMLLPWFAMAEVKSISVAQVNEAVQSNPSSLGTIIDVRTPREFAEGHVPGAINIPHGEIEQHVAKLSPLEKQGLVLYCRSGKRAGAAISKLEDAGFSNLTHMEGDMSAWFEAGYAMEKPTSTTPE